MNKNPMAIFQENDPELFESIMSAGKMSFAEGTVPVKYKMLIAMALDASHGAAAGVRSLAQQAMAAGATKEEIMEVLRVVYNVSGVASMFTAAQALSDLF